MLKTTRITTLLGWGFSIIIAMIVLIATFTHFKSAMIVEDATRMSHDIYPTATHADNIRALILRNWANTLILSESTDPQRIENITQEMAENSKDITRNFDALMESLTEPQDKALVQRTLAARRTYIENRRVYIAMVKDGHTAVAKEYLLSTLREDIHRYIGLVGKVIDRQTGRMTAASQNAIAQSEQLRHTNLVLSLLVIVLSATATWLIMCTVRRKLGGELEDVSGLAHEISIGNLDVEIKVRPDDHDSLVASMGGMRTKLRDVVGEIRAGSAKANHAARRLAATASAVSQSSRLQSDATSAMAAAIEEMTTSIAQISRNANHVQKMSRHGTQLYIGDPYVIQRASRSHQPIGATVSASPQRMERIGEQDSIDVAEAVAEIYAAIYEQSQACNDIALHVEKIARMAEENSNATRLASRSATELEDAAAKLAATVDYFKL